MKTTFLVKFTGIVWGRVLMFTFFFFSIFGYLGDKLIIFLVKKNNSLSEVTVVPYGTENNYIHFTMSKKYDLITHTLCPQVKVLFQRHCTNHSQKGITPH